jgi:hypothetical protein
MIRKILMSSLTVMLVTGCSTSSDLKVDPMLTSYDLARVVNTTRDDVSFLYTKKALLIKVDGRQVEESRLYSATNVKAGKRKLTVRCIYILDSLSSYIDEKTITADLVKGHTYKLYPTIKPKTAASKESCSADIKDLTKYK